MNKEQEWEGYYRPYLAHARRRGIEPLALLDDEWADGRETALSVLPHLSESSVVLEIACGIGRVSRHVASHCRRLHCADILDEALAEARSQLRGFDNVLFEKINGYDLRRYDAGSFDCVYSFTAFFHFDFELVVHYFSEIARVLRPGGTAIVEFKQWRSAKDVTQLLDKIEEQGGLAAYELERDKWRYVSSEMLAVLCEFHGLQILDPDTTKFTFRKP
jgi:ubiquinone/menaquinone biosynthesis C-methylase UbiE